MIGTFPSLSTRTEMNLDCTDEQWDAFIRKVEAIGEREIQAIIERQKQGTPEPKPAVELDPSILYYWQHLMNGGDK